MVLQTCHGCMLSFKSPGFASYWFLGWSRGGHLWFDGHLCGSLRCLEHWVVDLHDPFICQFLRDRVEELGPQNESVRSFPRAELLYAVFVKSSWLLWRRKKKQQEHKPILLQRSTPENLNKSRNPWSWFWAPVPSSVRRLQLCHTFWRVCPFGLLPVETSAPWLKIGSF